MLASAVWAQSNHPGDIDAVQGVHSAGISADVSTAELMSGLLAGRDMTTAVDRYTDQDKQSYIATPRKKFSTPAAAMTGIRSALATLKHATNRSDNGTDLASALLNLEAADVMLQAHFASVEDQLVSLGVGSETHARLAATRLHHDVEIHAIRLAGDALQSGGDDNLQRRSRDNLRASIDALLTAPNDIRVLRSELPFRRLGLTGRSPFDGNNIVPSYQTRPAPVPQMQDTSDNHEQLLTDAVMLQAEALSYDYIAIYDFVTTNILTEWYSGSMKGVDDVLRTGRGNAVDQARLLIALFRASGLPARFVHGVVRVTPGQIGSSLGLSDPFEISRALSRAGVAHDLDVIGGEIETFEIEHTWVSAYTPYANYRGATLDFSGPIWLPLDTSIKPHLYSPATDVINTSGILTDDIRQGYLQMRQVVSPLNQLLLQLENHLTTMPELGSVEDQFSAVEVDVPPARLLPASLPFSVLAVQSESAKLDAEKAHQLQIKIYASDDSGEMILDKAVPVNQVSNRRLTINYIPATADDQDVVNSFGGLDLVPAYLIRLRPQLNLAGLPIAVGDGDLPMGQRHRVQFELHAPWGERRTDQIYTAGSYMAIAVGVQSGMPEAEAEDAILLSDTEQQAARLLYNQAVRYTADWDQAQQTLARLYDVTLIQPLPSLTIVNNNVAISRIAGLPNDLSFTGVNLDAALRIVEPMPRHPDTNAALEWMRWAGLEGSYLEQQGFSSQWSVESISADSGIALAVEDGMEVFSLDQDSTQSELSSLQHPDVVMTTVMNQIHQGLIVHIPQTTVSLNAWSGSVWITRDPDTEAAGYYIAGGYNGGSTTEPPADWLLDFLAEALSFPYTAPPNDDALAAASIIKVPDSDFQIGVVNQALPLPLAVLVRDANGRPVQGADVTFSAQAGGGLNGVESSITIKTGFTGVAQASFVLGESTLDRSRFSRIEPTDQYATTLGEYPVRVSVNGRLGELQTQSPFLSFARPGDAVSFEPANSNTQSFFAAGFIGGQLSFQITDAYGNPVANEPVDFSSPASPSNCQQVFQEVTQGAFLQPGQCAVSGLARIDDCGVNPLQVLSDTVGSTGPVSAFLGLYTGTTHRYNVSATGETITYEWLDGWTNGDPSNIPNDPPYACDFARFLRPEIRSTRALNSLGEPIDGARSGQIPANPRSFSLISCYPPPRSSGGSAIAPFSIEGCARTTGDVEVAVDNGSLESLVLSDDGMHDVRLRVGAAPSQTVADLTINNVIGYGYPGTADDGLASITWDALTFEHTLAPVFAVDPRINSVLPVNIKLDAQGRSTETIDIEYQVLPEAFGVTAFVVIEDTIGNVITGQVELPGSDDGQVSFSRGIQFDQDRQYQARLIVNPGAYQIESDPVPLPISQDIVINICSGSSTDSTTDIPACAFVVNDQLPRPLFFSADLDIANQRMCGSNDFSFAITQAASIAVTLERLNANGTGSGVVHTIVPNQSFARGAHSLSISPIQFGAGDFRLEMRAISALDGHEQNVVGEARITTRYTDTMPVAHTQVMGVDLFDGHMMVSRQDISVPGRGVQLDFTRSYSSNFNGLPGVLGAGWTHNYLSQVVQNRCGDYIVIGGEGSGQVFSADGQGGFSAGRGHHGSLLRDVSDGAFTFYTPAGNRYRYTQRQARSWWLNSITDPNGNTTVLTYIEGSSAPRIAAVTDQAGRKLTFNYESGTFDGWIGQVLKQVVGPDGMAITFDYDQRGNLIRASRESSARVERYEYAPGNTPLERHLMTGVVNELNNATRTYGYQQRTSSITMDGQALMLDGMQVAAISETDAGTTNFSYTGIAGQSPVTSTVTPPVGGATTYSLNMYGSAETIAGPAGTTTIELNDDLLIALRTDAEGITTEFTYDQYGNLSTEVVSGRGTYNRSFSYFPPTAFNPPFIKNRIQESNNWRGKNTVFSYDPQGNLLSETLGGITESHTYNGRGDRISSTDGTGVTTQFRYDQYGNIEAIIDALQGITSQVWDQRSRRSAQTDANGNTTTFDYDTLDRIIRMTLPATDGQIATSTVDYDDGANRRNETDANGNTREFNFDTKGRQVGIINADGNAFTAVYDAAGNKTSETDWNGNTSTFEYDNANRLVQKNMPEGRVETFSYDNVGNILSQTVGDRLTEFAYDDPFYRQTRQTRHIGNEQATISQTYDGEGNLTSVTDAEGRLTSMVFDDRNREVTVTAPMGLIISKTWDASDRLLTETQSISSGSTQTRQMEYDVLGRERVMIDATGARTEFTYDAVGNRLSLLDANLNLTTFSYDARNRLQSQSGPRDDFVASFTYDANNNRITEQTLDGVQPTANVLRHSYDVLNRLISTTDNIGAVQSIDYDANGNQIQITDALGNISTQQFDGLNRLIRQTLPATRVTSMAYNVHGDLIAQTDARDFTTSFSYNQLGQQIAITHPDNSTETFEYDLVGNRTATIDANNQRSSFDYDALNRMISQTDPPDGSGASSTQSFSYDLQGNLIRQTDRNGNITDNTYDAENRLRTSTHADVLQLNQVYDDVGNLRRSTDANGNTVVNDYDAANALIREIRPQGAVTTLVRDALGNVVSEQRPAGRSLSRSYDARGRVIAETNHAQETTSFEYDDNDNLIQTTRPDGNRWQREYDAANRMIGSIDPEQNRWSFDYDSNDNRISHSDPNGQTTTLDYDNRNRLISVSYPDSNTETMAYDGMGNLITSTDANGNTTSHDHDQRNRRIHTSYSGATGAAIAAIDFAYDNNSNLTLVEMTTANSEQRTTLRQYDAFDRLEQITDRFGNSLQYAYDANGNRRQLIDHNNRITQYSYDELNRLQSISAPLAGQVVYSYYNNSQLRQIEWPNGTRSNYQYDGAERIERIEHQLAGSSFAQAQYDYDLNGNRSQQIIIQGTQTEQTSYGYDAADRLTQILEPNRSISYTLDGSANRITELVTDNNQTTVNDKTYSYNSRDQLESVQDAITAELITYQYDNNGNQTQKTDSTGTTNMSYGPRDRLLTITLPGAPPMAYSYNDQGLRDSQSQNGTQLNHLYDQQSLIAESNSLGDEIARYTHSSVGLIAEARNGIQTYIHGDALNTPIAITDTTGAVTSRYTWDSWGNLQQQTGISQQPFGFTGYQRDEQTGLHYAQQRYYDSEIGRFNRHDPFRGDINIPLSLHRYLYANANPTIYVDPTGEFPYLQNKADQLADFRKHQLDNAGNFQRLADSGIGGRTVGVLASIGSGLLALGSGTLEAGTRSVNLAANLTTRAVISDGSALAGQLDSELDDSFAIVDQVLISAEGAARLVVEDPAEAASVAVEFAISNAQKVGNKLDRAFIQGDTRALAEITEFSVGAVLAGGAGRVAGVTGRQALRQAGVAVEKAGQKAESVLIRMFLATESKRGTMSASSGADFNNDLIARCCALIDRDIAIELTRKGKVPGLRFLDKAGSTGRFQDTGTGRFVSFTNGQRRASTTRELISNTLETRNSDAALFARLQEAENQLNRFTKPTPRTAAQVNVERTRLTLDFIENTLKVINETKELFE